MGHAMALLPAHCAKTLSASTAGYTGDAFYTSLGISLLPAYSQWHQVESEQDVSVKD